MRRFALFVLCAAAALPTGLALATSKPTGVTAAGALNDASIVSSELTRIVRSAQPILNPSGGVLADNFAMNGAAAAAGFYVGGPNTQDLVLFFFFNKEDALGSSLGAQEKHMSIADGASPLGSIAGYPPTSSGTLRSLVWDQATNDAAITYAAITIPDDVNGPSGSLGGTIVEGVAIEGSGMMPPPQSTAIALARWGATHLARVLAQVQ